MKKPIERYIPLTQLGIADYQRPVNEKLVDFITEHYDPRAMRPLEVNFRDGIYWILDGQHRYEVLRRVGAETALCRIHQPALTKEAEADEFNKYNGYAHSLTSMQTFNSLVESENVEAKKIEKVVEDTGLHIDLKDDGDKGHIKHINQIKKIYKIYGEEMLTRVLIILNSGFNLTDKPGKTTAALYMGLARFLKIAEAQDGVEVDPDILAVAMSKRGPENFWATVRERRGSSINEKITNITAANLYCEIYNKEQRKRGTNVLQLIKLSAKYDQFSDKQLVKETNESEQKMVKIK